MAGVDRFRHALIESGRGAWDSRGKRQGLQTWWLNQRKKRLITDLLATGRKEY